MRRRIKRRTRQDATILSSISSDTLGASHFRNSNEKIPCLNEDEISSMEMHSLTTTKTSQSPKQSTRLKVRTEKTAVILALIVILFLFTHGYRMALKLYEAALPNTNTIARFKLCFSLKR
jgi:hypothetical protein